MLTEEKKHELNLQALNKSEGILKQIQSKLKNFSDKDPQYLEGFVENLIVEMNVYLKKSIYQKELIDILSLSKEELIEHALKTQSENVEFYENRIKFLEGNVENLSRQVTNLTKSNC